MNIVSQTYLQYLKARIEFQARVCLWMEFDIDTDIPFEYRSIDDYKQVIEKGDISIVCMKLASVLRKSPRVIAETLKPYVEKSDGVERVEVVNGYLNVFYDRLSFLINVM